MAAYGTTSPSQLFLLADHIKLSLLERQRAIALSLPSSNTSTSNTSTPQDSSIARSLDTLESGIRTLDAQINAAHTDEEEDPLRHSSTDAEQLADLRAQFDVLSAEFRGGANAKSAGGKSVAAANANRPNDPTLQADFDAARKAPGKGVRFTDSASPGSGADARATADRAALFPYRDDPEDDDAAPDHSELSNTQIHAYHAGVIRDQDEQLDRLGTSIGRQRELSIAIGGELDEQVVLLDDVDERIDRHQGQLSGANRRLNTFARRARQNWGMTTIVVLIVVLVLLIVITK